MYTDRHSGHGRCVPCHTLTARYAHISYATQRPRIFTPYKNRAGSPALPEASPTLVPCLHASSIHDDPSIHPSIHPWTRGRLRHSSQWCRCTLLTTLGIALHIDSRGATAGTSSGLRHTDRTAHRRATRMGSRARTLPRQCSLTPVLTWGTTRRGNRPHHTHARTHARTATRTSVLCACAAASVAAKRQAAAREAPRRGQRPRRLPSRYRRHPKEHKQRMTSQCNWAHHISAEAAHDVMPTGHHISLSAVARTITTTAPLGRLRCGALHCRVSIGTPIGAQSTALPTE